MEDIPLTTLPPALVISHGPGGLGTVRSLARCGVRVTVIAYDTRDPVLRSRYPVKKYIVPGDPTDKDSELLNLLRGLPADGAVLLFTSDQLVSLISSNEDELRDRFRFKLPPKDMVDALNDKRKETALIESLGFAIPRTIHELPSNPGELSRRLRFPIIFKPYSFEVKSIFPEKVVTVKDQDSLERFYRDWSHALPVLLAQEVIPGPDDNSWVCSGTFDEYSNLLDCLVRQKLRTMPPHFGTSTYSISRINTDILSLARDLGKALNYIGHAGVEYRWDDRDQMFKYIELNPRIGGEVGFDEACGLPTVWNTYCVSAGKSVSHSGSKQREGLYFVNASGDIRSMRQDGVSLIRILTKHFAYLFRPTSGQWFRWYDPLPGVTVALRFLARLFRLALKKGAQD
jgi:predicted ATP-grasp superfamily ATP-dependent carboligase